MVNLGWFHGEIARAPPWLDKSKGYELMRLCSGLRHSGCQFLNGTIFRLGIGTNRDLVRAYAHYDVARQLNHADAAKFLKDMDGALGEDDKARAAQLTRTIWASLKPVPPPWHMQYVGVAPPPAQWAVAPDAPDPVTATAVSPAAPREATAPSAPLMPIDTIKRIAWRTSGQTVIAGAFTRDAGNVWIETNSSGRTFKFASTAETDREILLLDSSRDIYLRLDLAARKWFLRRGAGGNWSGGVDILSTSAEGPDAPGVNRALDENADRAGPDYVNFPVTNLQAEFCQQSCIDDAQCRAFVYVRPGVQGPQARCWLKKQAPPVSQAECCVSGAVRP